MMMHVASSQEVVCAQSYILGASVLGFLLYPVLAKYSGKRIRYIVLISGNIVGVMATFVIVQHTSYAYVLIFGLVLFVTLGMLGSAVFFIAGKMIANTDSTKLARNVGVAYCLGIVIQFLNNNFINSDIAEAIVLTVCMAVMSGIAIIWEYENYSDVSGFADAKKRIAFRNPSAVAVMMIIVVGLMTCIFASLDNAVTLIHAAGKTDLGQWPRLILAVSGLVSGLIFDMSDRKYMNIAMYCVTVLSAACIAVIQFSDSYITGIIVFYFSAGFFAVYFNTVFIQLSYHMKLPQLWAGLGRAVNNAFAVLTGFISVNLLSGGNNIVIIVAALVLFAVISGLIFLVMGQTVYLNDAASGKPGDTPAGSGDFNEEEHFKRFVEEYRFTNREREILKAILSSEDNVQNLADSLFISRAALYRHIANMNEKTGTKTRTGLVQHYYSHRL